MDSLFTNQTIDVVNQSLSNQCLKDTGNRFLTDFLYLFYIISPWEEAHENPYDVPDYEVTVSI